MCLHVASLTRRSVDIRTLMHGEINRYLQRDNTKEPIVARHRDTKFLNPMMGDFLENVVKDGWSMPDGKGDYIAPGKQKVHNELYGQFYGWLQKYTRGELGRDDVPPGLLSPWNKPHDVRRAIGRLIREKRARLQVNFACLQSRLIQRDQCCPARRLV